MRNRSLSRGVIAGLLGGLAGDVAMQLVAAGLFALLGWPLDTSFRIIGDSALAFVSASAVPPAGHMLVGVLANVLVGIGLGALLGALVVVWKRLALTSLARSLLISFVHVEVMSVPLLAAGCLSLGLSVTSAATWCGLSCLLHLVYGVVLGAVLWRWLGTRADERSHGTRA